MLKETVFLKTIFSLENGRMIEHTLIDNIILKYPRVRDMKREKFYKNSGEGEILFFNPYGFSHTDFFCPDFKEFEKL